MSSIVTVARHRLGALASTALVATLLVSCGSVPDAATGDAIRVVASIPPLAFLAERVGGEAVAVSTLIPPGGLPEGLELRPAQALALARAEVYLGLGAERLALEGRFLRGDGAARVIVLEEALGSRDHAGEVAPGSELEAHDPHVWLLPEIMVAAAHELAAALAVLEPEEAAGFAERARAFELEVVAMSTRLAARLAPVEGRTLYTQHPSWGVLVARFGIVERALEAEAKEATILHLIATVEAARADGCRVVFAEPLHPAREAELLAREIGARVERLDPLAYDWIANLDSAGRAMRNALEVQRG
jgi:zinc transport system substrate-binding protein